MNRNGKSKYNSAGFTIDMWKNENTNGAVLISENSLTFSWNRPSTSTYAGFIQFINNAQSIDGKTCTWSILAKGEGTVQLREIDVPGGFKTITLSDTFQVYSLTTSYKVNSNGISYFRIISDGGLSLSGHIDIVAAKLELGPQQTLAHQDAEGNWVFNDSPNYDLQYALCSQYSPITGEWVGSQHSNPNLLDNWYFPDPINQRGQTEYAATGYTIDRWYASNHPIVSLEENEGVTITLDGIGSTFMQVVDGLNELRGKMVTFSALTTDNSFATLTVQIPTTLTFDTSNAAFNGKASYIDLHRDNSNKENTFNARIGIVSGSISLIAAKLELGSVQTLAHKEGDTWVLNDPPPNKALELEKCQRHQIRIRNNSGLVLAESATLAYMYVPLPTSLRANPTVSGSVGLYPFGVNKPTVNNIEWGSRSDNMIGLKLTGTGFTVGSAYAASSVDVLLDSNL